MTLQKIINIRKNRYKYKSRYIKNEFYKGYMIGWYHAYKDLEETLAEFNFNTDVYMHKSYNKFQKLLLKLFF